MEGVAKEAESSPEEAITAKRKKKKEFTCHGGAGHEKGITNEAWPVMEALRAQQLQRHLERVCLRLRLFGLRRSSISTWGVAMAGTCRENVWRFLLRNDTVNTSSLSQVFILVRIMRTSGSSIAAQHVK